MDIGDAGTIALTIGAAGSAIAGALKLLAMELRKAIDRHGSTVKANTQALDRLTTALDAPIENGPADPMARINPPVKRPSIATLFLVVLTVLAPVWLSGCRSGPDPMTLRAYERRQEIWEQDRRVDLDPDLVKSRLAEFKAHERYERSR